jgi:hypothetical protein
VCVYVYETHKIQQNMSQGLEYYRDCILPGPKNSLLDVFMHTTVCIVNSYILMNFYPWICQQYNICNIVSVAAFMFVSLFIQMANSC